MSMREGVLCAITLKESAQFIIIRNRTEHVSRLLQGKSLTRPMTEAVHFPFSVDASDPWNNLSRAPLTSTSSSSSSACPTLAWQQMSAMSWETVAMITQTRCLVNDVKDGGPHDSPLMVCGDQTSLRSNQSIALPQGCEWPFNFCNRQCTYLVFSAINVLAQVREV